MTQLARVQTSVLDIAYESSGPIDADPVVLIHGFPYDARAFDDVVPIVNARGLRTIVPHVRGFGGTRFLESDTMRSGEQAAIGCDIVEFLDVLGIESAILAGFDWGARAACIVAALWPNRVRGLVSSCGYQILDIAGSSTPAAPEMEQRWWYQYYFHTERGRLGLTKNRYQLCRLLWTLWSPMWTFDEATFNKTATSFENPDFVEVVIHSYRHRHGNERSDPRYSPIAQRLAAQPKISVPTIAIHGALDGVMPPLVSDGHEQYFTGPYERRIIEGAGHNLPQEAPENFARAILDCDLRLTSRDSRDP